MAPTPIVHELDVVKLRYGQTLECAQRVRAAPLKPLDFTAMRVHCGPRSLFTAPSSAGVKASKAIDAPTKFSSITICATLSSSVAKSALGVLLFSCVTSAAAAPEAAASAAVSSPLWLLESIPPLQLAIAAAAVLLVGLYLSGVIEFDSGIWHQWKGPTFLNKKRQTITLAEREMVTHDVVRLKFALPEGTAIGLPVGQATKFYMPNIADDHETWNPRPAGGGRSAAPRCDGSGPGDLDMDGEWKKEIMRKYTPSTLDSHVGYVEYLIKVYGPQREGFFAAAFPDGGKASQYLRSLEIGDTLALQGPVGHLQYFGRGKWKKYGTRMKIGLLAGGSGVTPMLQVIQAVLSDPRDNTRRELWRFFSREAKTYAHGCICASRPDGRT